MQELTLLFSLFAFLTAIGLLLDKPRKVFSNKSANQKTKLPRLQTVNQRSRLLLLMEVPDFSSLLWFLLSAGHNLEQALRITVDRSTGEISSTFRTVLQNVDFGGLIQQELEALAENTKEPAIRELASKLAMASLNGSMVADQLGDYVQSLSKQLRSLLLDKAQRSETKMMIPLVFIILPVTVVFALYPSVAIIQKSFG